MSMKQRYKEAHREFRKIYRSQGDVEASKIIREKYGAVIDDNVWESVVIKADYTRRYWWHISGGAAKFVNLRYPL